MASVKKLPLPLVLSQKSPDEAESPTNHQETKSIPEDTRRTTGQESGAIPDSLVRLLWQKLLLDRRHDDVIRIDHFGQPDLRDLSQ